MKIRIIKNLKNIRGKKILLRCDFNVPIVDGKIMDDYKIVAGLPTIRFLSRYGAKVIIVTHLGDPDGKINEEYTVEPIAKKLNLLLHQKVIFIDDVVGFKAGNEVSGMENGDILVLENLRFYKGEEKNDQKFAKSLSQLADIYINNAFAVSHRKHASVSAIKKYLPSYVGFLVEKEIKSLDKIIKPEKPLIAVIGGVKAKTKIEILKKISSKADKILIGGALANNFLKIRGYEIGESIFDKESFKDVEKLNKKNILLPIDAVVKTSDSEIKIKNINKILKTDKIYDIGPETIKLYASYIKKAKTIIWNGPMGMFEESKFKHGTIVIGRTIAARSKGTAFGVAGGGETIEALNRTDMQDYMDWVSTGGGAMLAYLGGERMPGLE